MSHLITTVAKQDTCPRCRQPTLAALDAGIPARVDIQAIDQAGELAALLDNKWTYEHTTWGSLIHRDATRIAAGPPRGTIHAQHKCPRTRDVQEGLF